MTNTHTTLAKSRGAWGSIRWCRACQEKTWETCNPEADLEREEFKQEIDHQSSVILKFLVLYGTEHTNAIKPVILFTETKKGKKIHVGKKGAENWAGAKNVKYLYSQ